MLSESYGFGIEGNSDIIEKLGDVDVYDYDKREYVKVNAADIIKVVADAQYKMARDYPYLNLILDRCKIMYVPVFPSEITDTMCVDTMGNCWINFTFVYYQCKMDKNRVFGILFHELFHLFFDHLIRFDKKYPADMFKGMEKLRHTANKKANICMDYEVNSSMVEDGIVSKDFFKNMNGLYKKEYSGMTWEEIMDKYGDKEFDEWSDRNGDKLSDLEKSVLEAIEKAASVLLDPDAEDDEKSAARRKLQKTLDELLGKEDREKTLQDAIEELGNTRLGDIDDIARSLDDVVGDLYKDPSKMSDSELNDTMKHIDKMMDDMIENSDEISKQFGKNPDETFEDIRKSRESLKKAIQKMKEGGMSKSEKEDLINKAKDDLEDIISDEITKEKLKKKREERDAEIAKKRKEELKKKHPLRKMIVVIDNFIGLDEYNLISENTIKALNTVKDDLDKLTEKKLSDFRKSDLKELSKHLDELKDSFLPDLVALIDNETILNKTEDDMRRLLDGVFEHVFNAFRTSVRTDLDDDAKGSVLRVAADKLRIIGKVLKTQKVWRVGDEFKEGYKSEMKRLMDIYDKDGEYGLFKELADNGGIDFGSLDENGRRLLKRYNAEKSAK